MIDIIFNIIYSDLWKYQYIFGVLVSAMIVLLIFCIVDINDLIDQGVRAGAISGFMMVLTIFVFVPIINWILVLWLLWQLLKPLKEDQ